MDGIGGAPVRGLRRLRTGGLHMKHFAALTLAMLVPGAIGTASAADMGLPVKAPAPPLAANWGGFYVGAHFAHAWNKLESPDPAGTVSAGTLKGWFGGVQGGYNWQMGAWVLGVEGDGSWGEASLRTPDGLAKVWTDHVYTATGRLG
jgi:opacity protein-like surface antigen